ncbi:Protein SET-14 [Aphelenchoides avenae]|nr:Protein SET-14 [Aphelenchus avenae]
MKNPKTPRGIVEESLRLVLRLHVKSSHPEEEVASDEAGPSRTFESLMWHTAVTETEDYLLWAKVFREYAPNSGIDDELLKLLYGKMCINAFSLTNSKTAKIGLALHIRLSAINHSCKPKARIAYSGNEAIMVPTIRMPEGFVLTIDDAQHSYINDLLPREERRRLLRSKYNFDCFCEGCRDEQREKDLTGFACEACGSCVELGGTCLNCNARMSEAHMELCQQNTELMKAAANAFDSAPNAPMETKWLICQKILMLMEGIVYKYNGDRFSQLRTAMAIAIKLKKAKEAIELGEQMLEIQERYHSEQDLSLMHAKVTLANLYVAVKDRERIRGLLEPIEPVFTKIYGGESKVVESIRIILKACSFPVDS